jgi:hypothetical protein
MELTPEDRNLFRAAARAVDDAQLAASASTHNYRNALTAAVLLVSAAALLFPFLAAQSEGRLYELNPSSTPSSAMPTATSGAGSAPTAPMSNPLPNPSGTSPSSNSTPGTQSGTSEKARFPWSKPIASIELWGVLGALVGAIAGLRNLRGSAHPIGLQLAQIALKIPTGALTALAGIVLLQAALTPTTQSVSTGKLAALAVVFGAAQEALTSFVDRTAGTLLDKGNTLGEKTTSGM